MYKFKTALFAAFVIAILLTPAAFSQNTAAKLSIVSGNGQLICPGCAHNTFANFYPLVVQVTDAAGKPVAGQAVTWGFVSGSGQQPTITPDPVTDSNGLAVARISQFGQGGNFQTPFIQFVIRAELGTLSADFTETQGLTDPTSGIQFVVSSVASPEVGTALTGPAGSTGSVPIRARVSTNGAGVPNISVRLLSVDAKTQPSANCATQPGADPGSVLTDADGFATCTPVFGSVIGNASVSVLVGGLDPANFDYSNTPERPLTTPVGFATYLGYFQLAVTAITPAHVNVVSGNNQSINPGAVSSPLVAEVTDTTGNVKVGNTAVVWTITPAGAATLSSAQTTTDVNGQTKVTATRAPNATGQITVKAALASNASVSATFNLSTNIQVSSVAKVSGDNQTAQANQSFALPLVVQVNGTNGAGISNQPVSFVVNGDATSSVSSALTDGTGRAQTTIKAGATAGAVTVTAFVGTVSQAFTLTVIPPGPSLTTSSFYNAGGGLRLTALAPCGLVTAIASGLAPNVQGTILNSNAFGPWGTTLAGVAVSVNNVAAPMSSVANLNGAEQVTFQVPCEATPAASVPVTINVSGGTATVNLPVVAATPGIFETVMTDGVRRAVAIRPDGSFVTLLNPARPGEVVRVYVTGMGPASPALATGALPFAGSDSLVVGQVIIGVNNAGTRVVNSRVSPNQIGVYELAFQVPSDAPANNNVVLSVAVNAPGETQTRFSNGSKLVVR